MDATRLSEVEFASSIDRATILALACDSMAALGGQPVASNVSEGIAEGCFTFGKDSVVVRALCWANERPTLPNSISFSATVNGFPDQTGIGRSCKRDVADSFADRLAVTVLENSRDERRRSANSTAENPPASRHGATAKPTTPQTKVVGPVEPTPAPSLPKPTAQKGMLSPAVVKPVRPGLVQRWGSMPIVTRILIAIYAGLVVAPLGLLLMPDGSDSSAPSPSPHTSPSARSSVTVFDMGACVNRCAAALDACNPRPGPQCAQNYRDCTTSCTQAYECDAYRSQNHPRSTWPGYCR